MLGMTSHPHHSQFVPKFCKKYADIGEQIRRGLEQFKEEVEEGQFPSHKYSPYVMSNEELAAFDAMMAKDEVERRKRKDLVDKGLREKDEYEILNLYSNGKGVK